MPKNLLYLIIIIACFIIYLRFIEKRSIFFPMKEIKSDPEIIGLSFEEVNFKTADNVELNGWFIPREGAKDTIIFCHGNGGNISHRLEKIAILHNIGLNVFIFDYRGYGRSKGSPSEKGLYKDAEAAYGYLVSRDNISEENIVLYGESIGGAVAIDLAMRRKVKALITEETLSSVKDMIKIIYPFLPYFVFQSRFDSVSKIKGINVPKLIIHSVDDEIVPFRLGEKLFESASFPKEFLKIRGSHNTAFLDSKELFISGITSFVKAL